jgi:pimeloyl-ACP methyl ester carboxylesterase
VVAPTTPPPPGGRPIIAWAHPTSGVATWCAPSRARLKFLETPGLRAFLDRGYAVAATDYPGLGAPGAHPYLVGDSEGRAVLDSVRAAQALLGEKAPAVALWGHSQGGQAVLFAAEMAPRYAPELSIAGVAAAAPATDLVALLREDASTSGGKNIIAMALWSWNRVFGAPMDRVIDPEAQADVDRLASLCLESPVDLAPRAQIGARLQKRFLSTPDLTMLEPWRSLAARNSAPMTPPRLPVLLVQGTADTVVRPEVTRAYDARLCAEGRPVRLIESPGIGHGTVALKAGPYVASWFAQQFDGQSDTGGCAGMAKR